LEYHKIFALEGLENLDVRSFWREKEVMIVKEDGEV